MTDQEIYERTELLMCGDTAVDTMLAFDSSPEPKAFTRGGNTSLVTSSAQAKFGAGSLAFDGNTYLSTPQGNWLFGTADFTIDAWIYRTRNDSWQAIGGQWRNGSDAAWSLHVAGTNDPVFLFRNATVDLAVGTGVALARNTWTHVRACRAGDNLHLFQGGVLRSTRSGYGAHSVGNGNPLFLGWAPNTTDFFEGHVDEFRVVRGVALSTASFTPPTASALPPRGPVRAAANRGLRPVRSSAVSTGHVLPLTLGRLARDIEVGGQGRIWGTTKIKGSPTNLPARARVVLLRQRDKMVVREAWSNAETGAFVFEGLDLQQQFVALAEDAAGNFRAVAAQRLVPGVLA